MTLVPVGQLSPADLAHLGPNVQRAVRLDRRDGASGRPHPFTGAIRRSLTAIDESFRVEGRHLIVHPV